MFCHLRNGCSKYVGICSAAGVTNKHSLWTYCDCLQVRVWKNWMAMVPTSLATSSPPSWEHLAGRNPTCVSQIHMTSDRCDDVCLCEFLGFCIDRVEVSVLLACVTGWMVPVVLWQWWSQNVGRHSPCDAASHPRRTETCDPHCVS